MYENRNWEKEIDGAIVSCEGESGIQQEVVETETKTKAVELERIGYHFKSI